ncbi:MAG: hypothetical protein OEZ06_03700 [Myxococcales bacterium]|nr:hypothetical protein [Myxococcales bacterium]
MSGGDGKGSADEPRGAHGRVVGHHQAVEQEARLDHCAAQGIGIDRKWTGGGAIYIDPAQIGWELVARVSDLPESVGRMGGEGLTELKCNAAARGLELVRSLAQDSGRFEQNLRPSWVAFEEYHDDRTTVATLQ